MELNERETLCEDGNCTYYDGAGCCHEEVEKFPFKPRKKQCKYYEIYDDNSEDFDREDFGDDDRDYESDDPDNWGGSLG